ncbi:hypothetical protein [Jatrophihabitans lederbergiae]|uniref:Terminase n=1 Tax=Jatrophihabitans lederbergiae TaxID=3075547 RepID=A0ABU2JG52_9ACTN|nr:hypothetical protein [Jatrophihabitans sp. DSM 44399]MDT0263982.1 hypothetical protein [Jatrophihabitans sp. DSM 44399]
MTAKPRKPANLGAAGASLWTSITTTYELEESEVPLLTMACRQADDIARLEKIIAAEGVLVVGSKGQPRLSAVVAEVRQERLALARLLAALQLPEDVAAGADGSVVVAMTPASRRAQKASQSRWAREGRGRRGEAS